MKRGFRWACILVILALVYAACTLAFAQQSQNSRKKRIIVRVAKPYDRVENAIRGLGGDITYEYENVDAVAASLPEDKLLSLSALVGASALYKDVSMRAPEPINIPGHQPKKGVTLLKLTPQGAMVLNGDDMAQIGAASLQARLNRTNPPHSLRYHSIQLLHRKECDALRCQRQFS